MKHAWTPPSWIDAEAWAAFVEMRKAKGKRAPFTDAARDRIVIKLQALKAQGHDTAEVLWLSVENGWSGVFPLKGAQPPIQSQTTPPAPDAKAWHETRYGIERKAMELGMPRWDRAAFESGEGETFGAFAVRVKRKAGLPNDTSQSPEVRAMLAGLAQRLRMPR